MTALVVVVAGMTGAVVSHRPGTSIAPDSFGWAAVFAFTAALVQGLVQLMAA